MSIKHLSSICSMVFLTLILVSANVYAQPKVLSEIKNDFIERRDDWKAEDKYDFFLDGKVMKVSLGKEMLKLKNNSGDLRGVEIAPKLRKRFWSEYKNAKISVSVMPEGEKFAGLSVARYRHTDATNNKYHEQEGRAFRFVINAKGSVNITSAGTGGVKELYAQITAPASFKVAGASRLSIQRLGMSWRFYLNEAVIYTHVDNSNNSIESIRFITDGNSSAEFTEPSYVFYAIGENEPTFRSTINGKFCFTDNVAGFIVNEDALKACPTTGSDLVRYQSKPCPEMEYKGRSEYGEMLITFVKKKY